MLIHKIPSLNLNQIYHSCHAFMRDLADIQLRDVMIKIHPLIGFCLNTPDLRAIVLHHQWRYQLSFETNEKRRISTIHFCYKISLKTKTFYARKYFVKLSILVADLSPVEVSHVGRAQLSTDISVREQLSDLLITAHQGCTTFSQHYIIRWHIHIHKVLASEIMKGHLVIAS